MDASLESPSDPLDLSSIRRALIRLEETITFHLIERVQFPLNPTIYTPSALLPSTTFLDWYLREQERLQSRIRRYSSPDEHPFFPEVVESAILDPIVYPKVLWENDVNVNEEIKRHYTQTFLPQVCVKKKDEGASKENYGSSATCDIAVLQALSRRIHYGKFVAESKFRSEEARFVELIRKGDREGIGAAITNEAVEKKVLERLRLKAERYGTEPGQEGEGKIDADAVERLYRDFVIPWTKVVEVEYLMQRLVGYSGPEQ